MRKLLKEISVIPGVAGSCIFDKNEGAVCTELEADMPRDLTENVGIHFVRLVQMGAMNKLTIKSAHFRFDRYAVVGLPLEKGAILLAICDSGANCSLVATTAAMLVEDMRDELSGASHPARQTQTGVASTAGGDEDSQEISGVEEQLKVIEGALVGAIGPVAGMILTDYVNKWRQSGPVTAGRLPALITMLIDEIGDEKLAAEFKGKLRHLMS